MQNWSYCLTLAVNYCESFFASVHPSQSHCLLKIFFHIMTEIIALPVINRLQFLELKTFKRKKNTSWPVESTHRHTERRHESLGSGWRWEMQGSQLQPWQTGHVCALGQRTLAVFTGRRGTAEICWSRCWFMSQWVADNLEPPGSWQPKLLQLHIRPTSLWCTSMPSCLSASMPARLSACAPQQSQQMPGLARITLAVRGRAQTLTGVSKKEFNANVSFNSSY